MTNFEKIKNLQTMFSKIYYHPIKKEKGKPEFTSKFKGGLRKKVNADEIELKKERFQRWYDRKKRKDLAVEYKKHAIKNIFSWLKLRRFAKKKVQKRKNLELENKTKNYKNLVKRVIIEVSSQKKKFEKFEKWANKKLNYANKKLNLVKKEEAVNKAYKEYKINKYTKNKKFKYKVNPKFKHQAVKRVKINIKDFKISKKKYGILHISTNRRNIFCTLSDSKGKIYSSISSGLLKVKGRKRQAIHIVKETGLLIIKKIILFKLHRLFLIHQGNAYKKKKRTLISTFHKNKKLKFFKILRPAPRSHNGCRPQKTRRK